VIPVLTVEEMREADARALATVAQSVLVERAGTAVARACVELLGGAYGRRVVVVAGKGNNGADGRVAARLLARRGARVEVLDATSAPERIGTQDGLDLVVDAAYGTGFRGSYRAPRVDPSVPVVAVDIPSGVDGDTGEARGEPLAARCTVTFAALKPGLLQGDGVRLAGEVRVADIGLDTGTPKAWLIEDLDVAEGLPVRAPDAHKWRHAVALVAGSPGMMGAALLAARGAGRAGAGMVRLAVPGAEPRDLPAADAVSTALPPRGWAPRVLGIAERCRAVVVGPGLGHDEPTARAVADLVEHSTAPIVLDADGLAALGDAERAGRVLDRAHAPIVLTPHDGEFARLTGAPPGPNRLAAARGLAARVGAVVLLKGPTTVVADPSGSALVVTSGSARLATAGSGDVLAGIVGAFIARGLDPLHAAAFGAHVHGRAASLGHKEGLVASDLPELVADTLSALREREQ
jgi:hydroxyethylthiazole kinase-like uncharacterized protein yjeF